MIQLSIETKHVISRKSMLQDVIIKCNKTFKFTRIIIKTYTKLFSNIAQNVLRKII